LREAEPVQLTGGVPVSPAANKLLVDTIDYVHRSVHSNPHAAESPLRTSNLARDLAATALTVFPNTAVLEPTIEDRNDSTPVLLRRAMSFIDDNAHRDISVADIAEAIYVTPRALQYICKEHRGCTPSDYVRQVRLYPAHMELQDLIVSQTTVGQIAARWGFGHAGRFTVYYRQTYGESPYDTLRRDP